MKNIDCCCWAACLLWLGACTGTPSGVGAADPTGKQSQTSSRGDGAIGASSAPGAGPCALNSPAFCDTFETPHSGGRGGHLDEKRWSVARANAKVNPSQGELVSWPSSILSACGQRIEGVFPNSDTITCRQPETGRTLLTSVFDDAGGPAFQSLRVLQPFDFAGRVGRITFEIDAKTQTPMGHGWWWELVIADQPVPIPYQEFISHALMARAAIVLEFQGISSFDGSSNELSNVFVENGYKYARTYSRDQVNFEPFKTKEEVLNHIEVRISTDVLEVWATDLDDVSTFRRVARIDDLALPFSRGYVNLQHSQYNAGKAGLDGFTTYHIGSLGFDGPKLPVPRSYQVPDALTIGRTSDVRNLGYQIDKGPITLCCQGERTMPAFLLDDVDVTDASEARVNFNAWFFTAERSIEYRFNGGAWRSFPHPYPVSMAQTRAVSMPVPLKDLRSGQNALEMRTAGASNQPPLTIANVELEVVPR